MIKETLVGTALEKTRSEEERLNGKKTNGNQTPQGFAPAGEVFLSAMQDDLSSGRFAQVLWSVSEMLRLQRAMRRTTLSLEPALNGNPCV
jgi:hypothetical protein